MSKHAELIARLEAAEVGSRELDRELMALSYSYEQRHIGITCGITCWGDAKDTCCPNGKHLSWVWVDPISDRWKTNAVDGYEFTTSLDAAISLAERVLPDVIWRVERLDDKAFDAAIWDDPLDNSIGFGRATAPAIALCIAILRALDSQSNTA